MESHCWGKKYSGNGWGGYGYNIIPDDTFKYNYVDISYVKIMFDYGVITIILVLISYSILIKKAYNEKNYWLTTMIILVLAWAVIEPYMLNLSRNLYLLYFIPLLENYKIEKLDYKKIFKGRC